MNIAMKWFTRLAFLLAVGTLSGCMSPTRATETTGDSITMSILPDGTVMLGDNAISRDRLVKSLRKAGATPETTLYVNIPAALPLQEVSALTKTLASSGYRRVFYKRPKHTEARVVKP